ncbi:hypothetical protein L4X63_09370 [Geomonas sp. Red32]|uniref:hypothetical protein n=1 Tax=Geomonas sp. Red32 TaxID=2912856 RepID=UPI00202CCF5B|nr:hypothetical protein [Geomonas sp. Red32]MCM0081798.1 hypothetical protein [Geomonas sp. Red32]
MDPYVATKKALLANELSNNLRAAYRFSDAKGGNSGLSFGITQLDVSNNSAAVKCLVECGFTPSEIAQLKSKSGDLTALSAKLAAHATVVDKYDQAQIKECVDHVMTVAKSRGFTFANDEAIVHAADYHNQFFMSNGGKMANALVNLGRPVVSTDILNEALATLWGKKEPGDVKRRYSNIAMIFAEQQA